MELLKSLSEAPGAPGREEIVRAMLREAVTPVADTVEVDAMGNLIATIKARKPGGKRVALACHMDEIAFYVRNIDANGFIRVQQLGGFDVRNLFARRVRVRTRSGEIVGNLNPSGRPVHIQTADERKKSTRIIDLFIDTGLPAEEVKARVKPGDPVTLIADFIDMGEKVSGKSMDNRIACWTGVRLLERIAKVDDLQHEVSVAFTVQEEVGIRGAFVAAYKLEPEIGIAIDVTLAVDIPGIPDEEQITNLGGGVAIKVMDSSSISSRDLVDALIDTAEANAIPYQLELLPLGGTDAAALQRTRAGCKVVTLSVPCRYVHTVTETVHKKDLYATVDLLEAFLKQPIVL